VHNRPTGRSASGLQSPGSAPTKKKKNVFMTFLKVVHIVRTPL
jgi:hypothetical protein